MSQLQVGRKGLGRCCVLFLLFTIEVNIISMTYCKCESDLRSFTGGGGVLGFFLCCPDV